MAVKAKKAATRANAPTNLWTAPARPLRYGREQFRFTVLRDARRLEPLNIDPWVESADWERSGPERTGDLNFRRPLGAHAASLIAYGDLLRCEWTQYAGAARWNPLWRMKIATPQHQIMAGLMSLALSSPLDAMTRSKVPWRFRTDRQHPNGWTASQITVAVCRRFRIPVGTMPRATWRIHSYVPKSASPADVVAWAWGQEHKHTGRKFDLDTSSGILNIVEIAEPRFILVLGAAMADATVIQSTAGIASAVVATSTYKTSVPTSSKTNRSHPRKKMVTRKLRVKVIDQARLKRYGYIVKTLTAPPGMSSVAELRKWATQQLASLFGARKQVDFTHPGIPQFDRGTTMRLYLPEADLDQIVYATDVRHSVSAGSYQMQVTIGFDDPWADTSQAKLAAKKASVAKARGRTVGASKTIHAPKPKKAATRAHA